MAREILYKAWDLRDKEMVEVSLLSTTIYGSTTVYYRNETKNYGYGHVETNECELLEYIGEDTNDGTKIYGGYILAGSNYDCAGDLVGTSLGYVEYEDARWQVLMIEDNTPISYRAFKIAFDYIEVVGNIYQNPELLAGGTTE